MVRTGYDDDSGGHGGHRDNDNSDEDDDGGDGGSGGCEQQRGSVTNLTKCKLRE